MCVPLPKQLGRTHLASWTAALCQHVGRRRSLCQTDCKARVVGGRLRYPHFKVQLLPCTMHPVGAWSAQYGGGGTHSGGRQQLP